MAQQISSTNLGSPLSGRHLMGSPNTWTAVMARVTAQRRGAVRRWRSMEAVLWEAWQGSRREPREESWLTTAAILTLLENSEK